MADPRRQELIDELRAMLLEVGDGEHSICRVAQERGLFCRGFAQWKLLELKERYPQITRSRPHLTRDEMEELADRWQIARQFACEEPLACDVQQHEKHHRSCKGWDEFTTEELEAFRRELRQETTRKGESK